MGGKGGGSDLGENGVGIILRERLERRLQDGSEFCSEFIFHFDMRFVSLEARDETKRIFKQNVLRGSDLGSSEILFTLEIHLFQSFILFQSLSEEIHWFSLNFTDFPLIAVNFIWFQSFGPSEQKERTKKNEIQGSASREGERRDAHQEESAGAAPLGAEHDDAQPLPRRLLPK